MVMSGLCKLSASEQNDVLCMLRAVLQSSKYGVPVNKLHDEYRALTGTRIPLTELGYSSLDHLVFSHPNVAWKSRDFSGQWAYFAVADAKTAHIQRLIDKQVPAGKRKRGWTRTSKYQPSNKQQRVEQENLNKENYRPPHNYHYKNSRAYHYNNNQYNYRRDHRRRRSFTSSHNQVNRIRSISTNQNNCDKPALGVQTRSRTNKYVDLDKPQRQIEVIDWTRRTGDSASGVKSHGTTRFTEKVPVTSSQNPEKDETDTKTDSATPVMSREFKIDKKQYNEIENLQQFKNIVKHINSILDSNKNAETLPKKRSAVPGSTETPQPKRVRKDPFMSTPLQVTVATADSTTGNISKRTVAVKRKKKPESLQIKKSVRTQPIKKEVITPTSQGLPTMHLPSHGPPMLIPPPQRPPTSIQPTKEAPMKIPVIQTRSRLSTTNTRNSDDPREIVTENKDDTFWWDGAFDYSSINQELSAPRKRNGSSCVSMSTPCTHNLTQGNKRVVPAAKNPVSTYLHIRNLMRPFGISQLRTLLAQTGNVVDMVLCHQLLMSQAYVWYGTEAEAQVTRQALHGLIWPWFNLDTLSVEFTTKEQFLMYRSGGKIRMEPAINIKQELPDIVQENLISSNENATEKPVKEKMYGALHPPAKKTTKSPKSSKKCEGSEKTSDPENGQQSRTYIKEKISSKSPKTVTRDLRQSQKPGTVKDVTSRQDNDASNRSQPTQKLVKTSDDLFRKTKAEPRIYWMPKTRDTRKRR